MCIRDRTEASDGQDAWAFNRRVDIVIMSTAKDSVRALLPDAAKQLAGGTNANIAPPPPNIGPSLAPPPPEGTAGDAGATGDEN